MGRLIDADKYKEYLDEHWIPANHDAINAQPTVDAIPVTWIEERIKNANATGQTLIAHMWQELIDGYRREADHDTD